jgi:hypothetical protein
MILLGGTCDFVKDIALWYPLRVILAILGLSRDDETYLLEQTQAMFSPNDPEMTVEAGVAGMIAAADSIRKYFEAVTLDRRLHPRDDVASIIANAKIDGKPINDVDAAAYYVTIITAGHHTTSSTTSAGRNPWKAPSSAAVPTLDALRAHEERQPFRIVQRVIPTGRGRLPDGLVCQGHRTSLQPRRVKSDVLLAVEAL